MTYAPETTLQDPKPIKQIVPWAIHRRGETDDLLSPKRIAPTRHNRTKASLYQEKSQDSIRIYLSLLTYIHTPPLNSAHQTEKPSTLWDRPTRFAGVTGRTTQRKVRHPAYRTTDDPESRFTPRVESDVQPRSGRAARTAVAICGAAYHRAIARSSPARSRAPTTEWASAAPRYHPP